MLPQKSLFGFKIIGYKTSTNFAYLILISNLILTPKFGFEKIEYIAGNLYLIISNSSINILLLNSFFKLKGKDYLYRALNFFLIIYFPFSLYISMKSIVRLILI